MSYLRELAIVSVGVLIALFLSNIKENNQAKKYQIASVETIKNEIEANRSVLEQVMEKQTLLLDTIIHYQEDKMSIVDLFEKAGGLQAPTLSNAGLEFYKRNQIQSIDFQMMSTLIRMNILSDLIDSKLEKLTDFALPNVFVDSEESKLMVMLHLRNVLESEEQLVRVYENFIDEYGTTTNQSE